LELPDTPAGNPNERVSSGILYKANPNSDMSELDNLHSSRKSVSHAVKVNSSIKAKYRDNELDIPLEGDEGVEDLEPSSPKDTPMATLLPSSTEKR
jgi:hypothetical protein